MQISGIGVASAAVVVAVVLWTWRVLDWVWLRPKMLEKYLKHQGLEGTSYKLLFGDMKRSLKMIEEATSRPISLSDDISHRVLPFLHHIVEQYGKSSYCWNGPVPGVLLMNPDHVREVFNKAYDFPKRRMNPLMGLLATGLVSYNGDKWAKHRKIVSPAFHLEKLKKMMPVFLGSCSEMICKWNGFVSNDGLTSEVDVRADLASMTSEVISRAAFGSSYEEGKRIFQLIDEQGKLVMQALRMVYIPGWRFVPTKNNNKMKRIDQEMKSRLRWVIEKKRKAMEEGKAPNDDLLGMMLESNSGQAPAGGMSMEDVIEECKLFYLAGQETTTVLLVWTMILLGQHQDWQARARDEVLQVLGRSKPDTDSLSNLKIVTMILNEVLRLYPPIYLLRRAVDKEMKLGKLRLPAGVELTIPTLLIHRDQDLWGDDANEFRPERFADGISKATKNQVIFLPFGWGPRMCLGQSFGLLEAKLALAMILQSYRFQLSPSYTHAPHSAIALHPQFGAHLILHKLE